ncbi:MAG: FtsW/RodA/SpoVE family cell cycle protein [Muribaculaceae bacterium]|nr:FtsW/RodA/SpoVE family cell cycle protein [Muribaculaceae bacterium]
MKQDNELLEELEVRETIDGERVDSRMMRASGGAAEALAPAPSALDSVKSAINNARTAALAKKKGKPDPYIWGIYIMLLVISVIELFSASATEVDGSNVYGPLLRHGMFLVVGFGIVLWLQKTPYTMIGRLAWAMAIFSLGLLLLSSFMGVEINGAQRAFKIAGITIQPAEIVKLTVVCLLASILGKNQTPGGVTNKGVITAAVAVVIFGACLWKNGLTNTLLLMCVSICMMLIGGIQWRKFGVVIGVYMIAGCALYGIKYVTPSSTEFDEVKERQELLMQSGGGVVSTGGADKKIDRTGTQIGRVKRFLRGVRPEDRIDDLNRQVIFANFSQANGGMFGQGPGNSRESARLPLAFSDYIYSIIVEDTGFVGGALVLLLYLLLLARAGRIAYKCSRAFPAFLIMGCAVMIVFQALVHMAIVTGLFPVSGQPLPFISKGGTSVLVMSAALGIMLSVARFAAQPGDKTKIKAEKEALGADMQAANFSAQK